MKENFIIVLFADRDAAIPYDRDRDTNPLTKRFWPINFSSFLKAVQVQIFRPVYLFQVLKSGETLCWLFLSCSECMFYSLARKTRTD